MLLGSARRSANFLRTPSLGEVRRTPLPDTSVIKGQQKAGTLRSPGSLTYGCLSLSCLPRLVCENLTRCDLGWVRKQGF
jgi:hypothetical protein